MLHSLLFYDRPEPCSLTVVLLRNVIIKYSSLSSTSLILSNQAQRLICRMFDDKKGFFALRHFLNVYCKHFLPTRIIFQPVGQFLPSKFDKHFHRRSARLSLQSLSPLQTMFLLIACFSVKLSRLK